MDQTTDDYQTGALFGTNTPNTSAMDASTLNPAASGPSDWTTILTNGISMAAVNGINGAVNNAIVQGQIANANAATSLMPPVPTNHIMPLILIGAVLYFLGR